jgi:hypothetical protein
MGGCPFKACQPDNAASLLQFLAQAELTVARASPDPAAETIYSQCAGLPPPPGIGKSMVLVAGCGTIETEGGDLMSKLLASVLLGSSLMMAAPAAAMPIQQLPLGDSLIEQVAGGCGPGRWRGPYGECRGTPYYGPLPNGYYQPHPTWGGGCPPGYWRGPWGHCRDTPYHGRLPDGGWK